MTRRLLRLSLLLAIGFHSFAVLSLAEPSEIASADKEIRLNVPADWRLVREPASPAGPPKLIRLQKNGYTLSLAYQTYHASGAEGGRFVEAFGIPWLDADRAWTCVSI